MPTGSLAVLALGVLLAAPLALAQPSVTAIVNGASFEPAVAPGSLVAIYGKGMANATVSSPGLPLPTTLSGTTVRVNGVAAELHFVSDTQVNAVIPLETKPGVVPVVVTAGSASSQAFSLKVETCAPAIFTRAGNGTGLATVFSAAYALIDRIQPQQAISFYATGLGATAAGADGYTRAMVTPALWIGESEATVAYAGPSGYPGVYQVNAVAPAVLASERFFLTCAPAPYPSNVAEIGIPAGRNTTEASGEIQALYPKNGSAITYSPVLMAAKFTARFGLAAGAAPFPVAAVGGGGSVVFTVDPATRRLTAKAQVPTAAERSGDFSAAARGTGLTAVDFWNSGTAMPGNIVPASRLDPVAVAAARALPAPNADSPNFTYDAALPASGGVTLDDTIGATAFGGFMSIPYAPWLSSRGAAFRLYIDGKLVATDEVTYSLPAPPPPVVISLKEVTLASAVVTGGANVQGTVTLANAAPTGGVVVTLTSSSVSAAVPASVTVTSGQTSANFPVTTRAVTARTTATITARYGADTRTATLAINVLPIVAGPLGMQFVQVPPGEFQMGCSGGDTDCFDNELPVHKVKLTKGFEIAIYEVTQAQWQAVMGSNPSWNKDPKDPDNANRPVQQITWNDTQTFLDALNARKDGYRYRLPTEAEWEYAARAGTADKYAGGGSKEAVACIDWYSPCVVGSLKPNAWGIYDMIGNVREFCSDWWMEYYYRTSPEVDPAGPETGTQKPSRGGAWGAVGDKLLRVSSRSPYFPDFKNVIYGVRCVRQKAGN